MEKIADKLDRGGPNRNYDDDSYSSHGGGGRRNMDSRDLDRRLKEYEKENELKMEMLK